MQPLITYIISNNKKPFLLHIKKRMHSHFVKIRFMIKKRNYLKNNEKTHQEIILNMSVRKLPKNALLLHYCLKLL